MTQPTVDRRRDRLGDPRGARASGMKVVPEARGQRAPTAPGAPTSGSSTGMCRTSRPGRSGSRRTGEFILHAARLAEAEGCEMLCIGCEMVRADGQEAHWRALIADVREVYTGLVTYNCDKYQEDHVTWWDAVDVISSSGYYPIDSVGASSSTASSAVVAGVRQAVLLHGGRLPEPRPGRRDAAQRLGAAGRALGAEQLALLPRRCSTRAPRATVGRAASCCGTGRPTLYPAARMPRRTTTTAPTASPPARACASSTPRWRAEDARVSAACSPIDAGQTGMKVRRDRTGGRRRSSSCFPGIRTDEPLLPQLAEVARTALARADGRSARCRSPPASRA